MAEPDRLGDDQMGAESFNQCRRDLDRSCPCSSTRMASLPPALPDSPSAVRNIRAASQRSRHCRSHPVGDTVVDVAPPRFPPTVIEGRRGQRILGSWRAGRAPRQSSGLRTAPRRCDATTRRDRRRAGLDVDTGASSPDAARTALDHFNRRAQIRHWAAKRACPAGTDPPPRGDDTLFTRTMTIEAYRHAPLTDGFFGWSTPRTSTPTMPRRTGAGFGLICAICVQSSAQRASTHTNRVNRTPCAAPLPATRTGADWSPIPAAVSRTRGRCRGIREVRWRHRPTSGATRSPGPRRATGRAPSR